MREVVIQDPPQLDEDRERVVDFGYRASNVIDQPTMGGGFGLTKAATLIPRWGGQMKIASSEETGTRIEIRVPCPDS